MTIHFHQRLAIFKSQSNWVNLSPYLCLYESGFSLAHGLCILLSGIATFWAFLVYVGSALCSGSLDFLLLPLWYSSIVLTFAEPTTGSLLATLVFWLAICCLYRLPVPPISDPALRVSSLDIFVNNLISFTIFYDFFLINIILVGLSELIRLVLLPYLAPRALPILSSPLLGYSYAYPCWALSL